MTLVSQGAADRPVPRAAVLGRTGAAGQRGTAGTRATRGDGKPTGAPQEAGRKEQVPSLPSRLSVSLHCPLLVEPRRRAVCKTECVQHPSPQITAQTIGNRFGAQSCYTLAQEAFPELHHVLSALSPIFIPLCIFSPQLLLPRTSDHSKHFTVLTVHQHSSKYFPRLNLHNNQRWILCHPHFTDTETEAYRHEITYSRFDSAGRWKNQPLNLRWFCSGGLCSQPTLCCPSVSILCL